jgi:hypothetical protein
MVFIRDVLKGEFPGEIRIDELLDLLGVFVIAIDTFNLWSEGLMTDPAFKADLFNAYRVLNLVIFGTADLDKSIIVNIGLVGVTVWAFSLVGSLFDFVDETFLGFNRIKGDVLKVVVR